MINTIVNVITGETTTVDDGIAYVTPTPTAQDVRNERDSKLQSEVDVIAGNALRWAALSSDKQAEWSQYRTDLLGVPQQAGFPTDITWPTKPE